MKKLKITIFLLLISIVVIAQTYELKKSAFDISGLISSGSTYTLADAIGQSVTGKSIGSTYIETSGILHMNFGSLLGIEEEIVEGFSPDVFCLHGSYPNPCRSMAVIRFEVPYLTRVKVCIFDISGRNVKNIVDSELEAGQYEIPVSMEDRSPGIYFLLMNADTYFSSRKMVIAE